MHNVSSAMKHGGGLKTFIFYLLGSEKVQKIMKTNFYDNRSPGGDPQLDQISRNRQMGLL